MNKEQPQAAHPASSNVGEPPSDLELMLYFDDELEEPRRSIVAAFVGADLGGRNKLAGLGITSAIVQNEALAMSAADDIADLVMAKLTAETAPVAAVNGQVIPFPAPTNALPAVRPPNVPAQPAANDNARRIFGIAAFAVAAAAAFMLWSRFDTSPSAPFGTAGTAPIAVLTAPSTPASPTSAEPDVDAVAVTPEGDMEHGVEVAAVNFGAHMGSIFYVPSDSAMGARPGNPGAAVLPGSVGAQHMTTVVWLTDDAGE